MLCALGSPFPFLFLSFSLSRSVTVCCIHFYSSYAFTFPFGRWVQKMFALFSVMVVAAMVMVRSLFLSTNGKQLRAASMNIVPSKKWQAKKHCLIYTSSSNSKIKSIKRWWAYSLWMHRWYAIAKKKFKVSYQQTTQRPILIV